MTKASKLIILGAFLLVAVVTVSYLYKPSSDIEKYQVLATAPQTDNYLLPIFPHVKAVARPKETFNFPIPLGKSGPVNSLYSGPLQYPFYCMSRESRLGQPLVDNQQGYGVAVYNQDEKVIGYSKDCSLASRIDYYRVTANDQVLPVNPSEAQRALLPDELVLRVETGTINRFIYIIIMPVGPKEVGQRLAQQAWNKKLIYQFEGGSGIGFRQGRIRIARKIEKRLEQLKLGYSVISSSGNRTSYTYNMLLAEDTMRRVKRHFISLYGEPLYTVGVGGSGGALAQYLIAQNAPELLDAIIPQYSYPDMITQTTYALDCDLLNNYYTFRAGSHKRWQELSQRKLIEGMNSSNQGEQKAAFLQPVNQLMAGVMPVFPEGNSECINGWFGLSSSINNPRQGFLRPFYSPEVVAQTHWSYWQDNVWLLGRDKAGFARTTWDNQGVQYGLRAFNEGHISRDEFLHLNRHIGGWKPQQQMRSETILQPFGRKIPLWLSLWGTHNISEYDNVMALAPRQQASLVAIEAAYRGGQVFLGEIKIPVIDLRHYLENELDMHHVSASFSARQRLLKRQGHSDNHLIWVADKQFNPEVKAFELLDRWLLPPDKNLPLMGQNKPADAKDACFEGDGKVVAQGENVWDGQWNDQPPGSCSQYFPYFSNSRIEAGGGWSGNIFKCFLIPVKTAIAAGVYQDPQISEYQAELETIFPQGVCDYGLGDQGIPADLDWRY
jgi:hypothetical protein